MRLGPFRWNQPYRPLPGVVRLDDADIAALIGRRPKLSRIPPAHWRGVFQLGPVADYWFTMAHRLYGPEHTRAVPLSGGVWLETNRFVCAQLCEQRGRKWAAMATRNYGPGEVAYLRAEKFEGERP